MGNSFGYTLNSPVTLPKPRTGLSGGTAVVGSVVPTLSRKFRCSAPSNQECAVEVKRAYVWAQFKVPKSKASKAPVPVHPVLAGFLMGENSLCEG